MHPTKRCSCEGTCRNRFSAATKRASHVAIRDMVRSRYNYVEDLHMGLISSNSTGSCYDDVGDKPIIFNICSNEMCLKGA